VEWPAPGADTLLAVPAGLAGGGTFVALVLLLWQVVIDQGLGAIEKSGRNGGDCLERVHDGLTDHLLAELCALFYLVELADAELVGNDDERGEQADGALRDGRMYHLAQVSFNQLTPILGEAGTLFDGFVSLAGGVPPKLNPRVAQRSFHETRSQHVLRVLLLICHSLFCLLFVVGAPALCLSRFSSRVGSEGNEE
jgi:hypothetical protein